jgi:Icc-related predicted phosphoesterase
MPIRVLAVSDQIDPRIHSATIRERMSDVEIVFGCGDLPASYLEFLADALNRPVYFVYGNHLEEATRQPGGDLYQPMGCVDLGGRVVRDRWSGLILAGIPGSPRYAENEPMQFSEFQIRWMIAKMTPRLLWNRLRHGRALDILVSHSPARDLGDREDLPHRGFTSLRSFLKRWRPAYMLHGHVHLYDRSLPFMHEFEATTIINVYPFRVLDLDLASILDGKFPHDAEIHHPPMGDGFRTRPATAVEKERAHE